jgi:hypothetical protein
MVKLDATAVAAAEELKKADRRLSTKLSVDGEPHTEYVSAGLLLGQSAAFTAAALVAGAAGGAPPSAVGVPLAEPGSATNSGDSHAAAASMLPSLFILGRYCLQQAQVPQSAAASAKALGTQVDVEPEGPFLTELVLSAVQQWLEASSTHEQLLAAGYAPQALPQQLQQVVAALQAVRGGAVKMQPDSACCSVEAECVLAAAHQMQAVGRALCSFAVPCMCTNPACEKLSGPTELGLVSGRSCIFAGCGVARYCGRVCQRAAWKQHKPVCGALAAAATAEVAAAAASVVPSPPTGA